MSTERVPLARAVFSRRFLGPLSVHSGFLNLVRKSRESVGLGRSAFSPHYLSGGINPLSGERIPSTLQPTLGAGNMYARPHVLLSYPFIQSSERGEDRVFYEALGQDLPGGSVTGFTNPVAHIKGGMHARRSTALSNIVMEPGETNKVPQWKPKIESIKELLRARNAWWSRPQYAHEKQLLKKMVLNIEGQMGPIMRRDAERHQLPTETQAQRPAILPETPEGKQPTVFDMIRQGMFDQINQQMSRGPPQPQRVSPLLPAYRNIISDWRRMFPEESARIMPLIKLRQREHAEAQDRLHRVQAREIPNAESRELKDGD